MESADDGTSNGINDNLNGSFSPKRAFNVPGQSAPSYLRKDNVEYTTARLSVIT